MLAKALACPECFRGRGRRFDSDILHALKPPSGGFLIMFYLYIIYSAKLDRYYVGYTADIEVRIVQHNSGLSSFTSKANDWKLVYKEQYPNREEAHKRELEIKSKKSRKYIEWLIGNAG
jgi:putative endonuclease